MRAANKQRVSHWGNQFIFHGEQLIMIDGDGQAYLKPAWVRDCIIHERKRVYPRCGTGSSGCLQISAALQRRGSVGRIKPEESIFLPPTVFTCTDSRPTKPLAPSDNHVIEPVEREWEIRKFNTCLKNIKHDLKHLCNAQCPNIKGIKGDTSC